MTKYTPPIALTSILTAAIVSSGLLTAVPRSSNAADAAAKTVDVFKKPAPQNVDDLLAIEKRVGVLVDKLKEATVAVGVGQSQGSGVIVSADGYVLTAAHVAQAPGRKTLVVLSDGRRARGRTLGLNQDLDCGMVKITDPGEWPHVAIGKPNEVHRGDWCVALGHPRGYQEDRGPVLRLGRVVAIRDSAIQSDCTLAAGDSGGPLFDLDGKVIGIHSRIGPPTTWNFHIPAAAYVDNWDKLVAGKRWGDLPASGESLLGVRGVSDPRGCRISHVADNTPAKAAGLRVDDVIVRFAGEKIASFDVLMQTVKKKNPGERVTLEIMRDNETIKIPVVLANKN